MMTLFKTNYRIVKFPNDTYGLERKRFNKKLTYWTRSTSWYTDPLDTYCQWDSMVKLAETLQFLRGKFPTVQIEGYDETVRM